METKLAIEFESISEVFRKHDPRRTGALGTTTTSPVQDPGGCRKDFPRSQDPPGTKFETHQPPHGQVATFTHVVPHCLTEEYREIKERAWKGTDFDLPNNPPLIRHPYLKVVFQTSMGLRLAIPRG